MSKLGKITRIISKTLLFLMLVIVIFLITLFFAFQTETFQTWAAKKATNYLSKELDAKVDIQRLKISLISNVTLEGVFVSIKIHLFMVKILLWM